MDSSIRRTYLDSLLSKYQCELSGTVLDLGGKKFLKKGNFKPQESDTEKWLYLNNDLETSPDIVCNLPKIPIKTGSVDSVILIETLEYIFDLDALICEIDRVLNDQGKFLVSFPFLHSLHGDYKDDYYRITESCFKEYTKHKFKILKINRMGGAIAVIFDLLRSYLNYQGEKTFLKKIIYRVLMGLKPLCIYVDKFMFKNNFYINTGYVFLCEKIKHE